VATADDVRRIALSLANTTEDGDRRYLVRGKAFAWPWQERIDARRRRVPSDTVIAVRVASEFEKEPLIEMNPAVFFTEPHYDGYPAILVRLPEIDLALLEEVLTDGWRVRSASASPRAARPSPRRRRSGS
jgi:hypothetical protein